jgi:hypothetical protein
MKRLVVHVERLVLNGFPRCEPAVLAESLQRELARRLSGSGAAALIARRSRVAHVAVPALQLPASVQPAQIGLQLARGIARGIRS